MAQTEQVETRPWVQGLPTREKTFVLAAWWVFLARQELNVEDKGELVVRGCALTLEKMIEKLLAPDAKARLAMARERYWRELNTATGPGIDESVS